MQIRPIELQHHGSIGSISYQGQNVNISGEPFSSVVKLENSGKNKGNLATSVGEQAPTNTPEANSGTVPAHSISQPGGKSNTRFSIKYDQDNTPYVVVENDILRGVPKSQWVKAVKDNLREKFPDGVTVGQNVIDIDKQSIREMTYSRYTQWLMQEHPDLYADKLRVTDNADEILQASQNYVNEALMHPRKDNITDFARGNVLLQIGSKDYSADVVVGMRSNGRMLLYDILNLKRTQIKEKTGHSHTVNPQESETGRTAVSSNNSISQPGEKSNTQNSLKGSEDARSVSELERENRELRKRVEHFKEQLHLSKRITTDRESTRREARQLIQDYSADLETDDIAGDLQSLYDFMASGKDGENELSYDAARERSDVIARRIVENAVVTDDSAYRQYSDLRGYLRSNKLIISPEDSRNIPDFNNFRKSNFGRMNIGTKGEANLDQVYGQKIAGNQNITLKLIDGRQLVDLMLKHKVGVTVADTFSTYVVDTDSFNEL